MMEANLCKWCEEEVCTFTQFEADVASLGGWQARITALKTNREKRKMMFRTYFRWSRGIYGPRENLDACVLFGARSLYPSRAYMGFCEVNDRSVRKRAEDIFGNDIDLWWEFSGGAWELEEE